VDSAPNNAVSTAYAARSRSAYDGRASAKADVAATYYLFCPCEGFRMTAPSRRFHLRRGGRPKASRREPAGSRGEAVPRYGDLVGAWRAGRSV